MVVGGGKAKRKNDAEAPSQREVRKTPCPFPEALLPEPSLHSDGEMQTQPWMTSKAWFPGVSHFSPLLLEKT